MNFDKLDRQMRVFETAHDHCVLPGIHIVARLDGRNFTRLTKEVCPFEAPYDFRFHDYMLRTVEHLMSCGFRVIFGYTQSDEISLLFHPDEDSFERKLRKYDSILAGEASARFALAIGMPVSFDCRVSQLPSRELVAPRGSAPAAASTTSCMTSRPSTRCLARRWWLAGDVSRVTLNCR